MSRQIKWVPFEIHIPTKDGMKIIPIDIPVYYDPELGVDIVCSEGHDMINNIKREYVLNS
jgi:hypothetical protein